MHENTRDLSQFGYREKSLAAELLVAYTNSPPDFLGDGVTIEFNPNSGCVFLTDEDFNVAMMNGDDLDQWHYCSECGAEGFADDFDEDEHHFGEWGQLEHGPKPAEDE